MDKCPKCGSWSLDLDPVRRVVACYSNGCDYEVSVDVKKYYRDHDYLPKLAESLNLEKKEKTYTESEVRAMLVLNHPLRKRIMKVLEE